MNAPSPAIAQASTGADFKTLLGVVATGKSLTQPQAEQAFRAMMAGEVTPSQIGAFLMALRVRGETVDEITAAVTVMREKMTRIEAPANAIDVCGTGGDHAGTLNISTPVAILCAACGVAVAKHGNRAASSKSGAADVLAALGVNIDAEMAVVQRSLKEVGTCFMWAPKHHSAMKHVGPTRVELGTRTVFNLMGPMSNPAGVKRQLLGVFSADWQEPMASVLRNLGTEYAWLVHGSDGLDEITTTGPTRIIELRHGAIRSFTLDPEDYGIALSAPDDLKGGDAQANAQAIRALFAGVPNAYRDIVLMNTAAALVIAERAADLATGLDLAAKAIDGGKANEVLAALVRVTNAPA
ncbi:MAG TPA: anthranilate phosphoribosyltransferase [Dongiaceae bacterium]|jgi:anthranilate phosphoribosyltransferase|nr:anthranilate phosphoribosyltransferase [Dongiaceae bacterium]